MAAIGQVGSHSFFCSLLQRGKNILAFLFRLKQKDCQQARNSGCQVNGIF